MRTEPLTTATTNTSLYAVYQWRFWTAYFVQMRPYLLFVSGIAGAAGIAMGKTPESPDWKSWIAFIPFFLGYGFGQALTDCFQTDTDRLSAPYRPLSKGIVSVRSVLTVSIAGLLLSGVVLFLLHPVSFLLSLLAVFGLATYSFVKKRYWFGGPLYNAWIVALLPLMGYYTNAVSVERGFPGELVIFPVVTFFSYGSFVLIGYLKDMPADEATGYKTFPVVFGWDKTILAGDVFALVTLGVFWSQAGSDVWELIFGIAGSVVIVAGQISGHVATHKDERGALIPILSTVRSFILLHISIVLHFQPDWWMYALIYYPLFEWTLMKRPSLYQV